MSKYAALKLAAEQEYEYSGDNWPDASGGYFDTHSNFSGNGDWDGVLFDYLSACKPSTILELIAENDELRKNSDRYLWLRKKGGGTFTFGSGTRCVDLWYEIALDYAMAQGEPQ